MPSALQPAVGFRRICMVSQVVSKQEAAQVRGGKRGAKIEPLKTHTWRLQEGPHPIIVSITAELVPGFL